MKVNIHAHNVEIVESLRSYAEVKVLKLDRHFDRVLEAHLDFEVEGLHHTEPARVARLRLHLAGAEILASVTASSWMATVDKVVDKADEQLRRRKERLKDHKAGLPG